MTYIEVVVGGCRKCPFLNDFDWDSRCNLDKTATAIVKLNGTSSAVEWYISAGIGFIYTVLLFFEHRLYKKKYF